MRLVLAYTALLLTACASAPVSPPISTTPGAELSFAVVSGTGVHRHGDEIAESQAAEATRTFDWLQRSLHEPQTFLALGIDAPPPDFLFICGNVTENGAIDQDWLDTEKQLDALGLPWYAAAGTDDMRHTPVFEGFEKRFGGLVYSFDRGGAHFIALCSATAGDLRPGFSPLQLSWLREDLARNADRKPVFLFTHHGPGDPRLSAEQALELRAACDGHDVAAVFTGESGHEARNVGGLDCIPCGSLAPDAASRLTEGQEDRRGYLTVSIDEGKLRVASVTIDGRAPRPLLEKALRRRVRAPFTIEAPEPGTPARGGKVELAVRAPSGPPTLLLDGEPKSVAWKRDRELWRAELSTEFLAGGAHQLAVLCDDDGTQRVATREFLAHGAEIQMRWRRLFGGSLLAPPVLAGDRLAVASTAGELAILDAETGEISWSAKTAGVIAAPWMDAEGNVVVADVKGWIEAFDREGNRRWRFQAGKPVFAALASDGELVFAADARGDVHALELATGRRRWKSTGPASRLDDVPRVADGRLVLQGSGLELVLDSRTGAELGRRVNVDPEPVGPVEEGGRIVRVSTAGVLEALDAESEPLWSWRATASGLVLAPPLLHADGTVWIAAMDGSLSCVRAR